MSDLYDVSDWGGGSVSSPATPAAPTEAKQDDVIDVSDWSNPEELSKGGKSGAASGSVDWLLDPIKGVAAGAAGDLAAASTGAQIIAERSGYPTIAKGARALSSGLHKAEKSVEESESPAFRSAQGAALIPSKDQEQLGSHPINEAVAKGSGVVAPAAVGMAGGALGAMLGSFAGPGGTVVGASAGTAGAGALYGLAKGVDQAVAWTNDLTDEQLEKEAPVFGQFLKMYLAEGKSPEDASYEARVALHDGLYGFKQAAFDAGTNAVAFGAGRKVITGALGKSFGEKAVEYALTGGALGAASASGDVNQQNVENVKKGTDDFDFGRSIIAFLNGTAEGLAFHGAGEAAHKLAKMLPAKQPEIAQQSNDPAATQTAAAAPATMDGLFDQKQGPTAPSATPAASTGATPKGTRATTQPAPNESAQAGEIGNTENPPTRDQNPATPKEAAAGAKAKATGKKRDQQAVTGGVTLMPDPIAPAPDVQEALGAATAKAAEAFLPEEQRAPAPPVEAEAIPPKAEVTPGVTEPAEVPEAPPTIEQQLDAFANKQRDVVRFENPDQVPDEVPADVEEHEASDGTVWWHRGDVTRDQIEGAIADKRENELLGLGPFNKEDVARDVAAGGEPTAVVARTPEGVEVASAASTDRLASETAKAVEDANPGTVVGTEAPEGVIEGRENGTGQIEPTGRILRAKLTPEQDAEIAAAEAEQAARLKREQDEAARREQAQSREKAKPGQTRRKLGKDDLALRQENLDKVQNAVDAHPPVEDEVASDVIDRAKRILAEAEAQSAKVPGTLPDNATGPQGVLREAQDLINHINSPEAKKNGIDPERLDRFVRQDKLFRGSDEDIALAKENRRAEAAAPKGKRLEGDGQIETGRATKGGTPKIGAATEKRRVIDKKGELREVEGARAASEVRSVQLSDAEKQALLDKLNAAAKPKDAPVNDVESKDARQVFDKDEQEPVETAPEEKVEVVRINRPGVGPKTQEAAARASEPAERAVQAARGTTQETAPREATPGFYENLKGDETGSARTGKKTKAKRVSTLADELRNVDVAGLGPLRNFIRKKLIELVGHVKVHVVDSGELSGLLGDGETKGLYTNHPGQGPVVSIGHTQKGAERAHTLIHEALHALSHEVLNKYPEFKRQIQKIMSVFEDHLGSQFLDHTRPDSPFHYAFKDVHEFLSEAWGNKAVHDELDAVELTPALARELGMSQWRGKSLWAAVVEKFRQTMRDFGIPWPEEKVSALEAIMKVTEDIAEERQIRDALGVLGEGGEAALTKRDIKNKSIDAASWLREQKRRLQTTTMISMSARHLGNNFSRLSRKVDDLYKRMTTDRNELLAQEGGLDLAREAADLAKLDPAGMQRGSELANRAAELQIDPTAAATNDHVYKVKDQTRGSQWWAAKKALDKNNPDNIKAQWAAFEKAHPKAAAFIERASEWGRKAKESEVREVLVSVLDRAKLYDPNLVSRILAEGKVPDADKARFKSETLIDHIDRFMEAEGRQGWYFPAMREGKHVVRAKRTFDVPKASHIQKISDNGQTNVVQIMDPTGGSSKLKARRAAKDFYDNHTATKIAGEPDQLHMVGRMEEVYVDKNNPTQLLDKSDVNSVPAYRIRLQDEWMSKHESEAEAREEAEALRQAGWADVKDPVIQRLNPNAKWSGMMPSQYETIINSLRDREKFKGLTPQEQAEQILAMHHANVKLLPGTRLQHTRLQRKNVAGYDKDLGSVVSRYVQMSAGFRARVRNIGKIEDALNDLRDDISSRSDKQSVKRWEIAHALEERIYNGQEFEKTPWLIAALGKFSMVTKLFGPSQPMINAAEPLMVTLPVLAGYHGLPRAVRAMKDAYSVVGGGRVTLAGMRDAAKARNTDHGFTDYKKFITDNITHSGVDSGKATRLAQLIEHLHDMNLFGHEAGMEIQRLEGTDVRVPGLDRADLMFRQVNQGIEAMNRAVSAIAAYNLRYERNGGNHFEAMEYARDVVHDTMGDYSAANASPMFNSKGGRIALQFKKYAQKSYGLMGKLAADSFHGDPDAKKAFAGVMITHGVMAGALGLPGMELVKAALFVPGLMGGYSWEDFQISVRSMAERMFGKNAAMVLTRGAPRALGVDTSSRLGWENLITPRDNPNKPDDLPKWFAEIGGGAPMSVPVEVSRTALALFRGDLDAAAEAQPSKFIRDIYRAGKGYSSGFQDKTGRQKLDRYSLPEAAVQALGFKPGSAAETAERNSEIIHEGRARDAQRQTLMNGWINAEDKDAAWSKIVEFNKTMTNPDARITPKQLIAQQKRRATEKRTGSYDHGVRVTKRNRDIVERSREVY